MSKLPIVDGNIEIIYEHGEPKGIRDRTGYLLHFNTVNKYMGQEERYRNELERRFALADFLAAKLKDWITAETKTVRP